VPLNRTGELSDRRLSAQAINGILQRRVAAASIVTKPIKEPKPDRPNKGPKADNPNKGAGKTRP